MRSWTSAGSLDGRPDGTRPSALAAAIPALIFALAAGINVPAVGATEYLTVDIDQIGDAGAPGADLTVQILYTED